MAHKRLENALFAIASLIVGISIQYYYTSLLPDFDIGGNGAWITLECGALTFASWGILLIVFRFIGKLADDTMKRRLFKITAVMVYWLIVWGYCYYQCTIIAVQDWNDMMNGNVG